jgi:predicted extracellular nuclease
VRWFPRGTHNGKDPTQRTDVAWLACAIALLDVDVLAVQEFLDNPEARNASADLLEKLDAITGGRHRLELDECAGSGRQHVGLLWNERRVTLSDARSIAALNPVGTTCGASLRPGFGAYARFADGTGLHVISVHLDSGEQLRDFEHRKASLSALDGVLRELHAGDTDALVLGDYNAMGCSVCTPKVAASEELSAIDSFVRSVGVTRLEQPLGNRCSHYYRGHPGLLDLALVSESLHSQVASLRAEGVCAALECSRPRRGASLFAWQTLSDHCPVVIALKPSHVPRR